MLRQVTPARPEIQDPLNRLPRLPDTFTLNTAEHHCSTMQR